jgi:ketosteroid isomerase-like protein
MPDADRVDAALLLRRVWEPYERGESRDYQTFYDLLDEDVVFTTPVGELTGKRAVVHYFEHAWDLLDARPFERPLVYLGTGDRVAVLGEEDLRVKATGAATRGPWVWVHNLRGGRVTRILVFQDLSAVADTVRQALARSQAAVGDERPA